MERLLNNYNIMKKYLFLVSLFAVLGVKAQYIEEVKKAESDNVPVSTLAQWQHLLWNDGWQFVMMPDQKEPTAEVIKAADLQWHHVNIPHDFQFEQPWIEDGNKGRGFKPMCAGMYRKTFQASDLWKGRKVFLDFDGVMYISDIWLNGKLIHQNEYGYTPFRVDLSKHLRYGEENTLVVWSSTCQENASRWYTGGGIYRNVYLSVQNPTHIQRGGVYITTPTVGVGESTVQIQVEVDGWQKRNDVRIDCDVLSPQGQVLASVNAGMPDHTIQRSTEVLLPLVKLQNVSLWSTETPVLYSVRTRISADGMVVDSTTTTFGIRHIEYGTDFGFKLNGKKVFLKGLANHHDLGALGVAAYRDAILREMKTLKEFGFNAIRCSHNPYSDDFYDLADSLGLLIVDELIDKWSDRDYWGGRKAFTAIWPNLMKEWLLRDRNHPSIVMWSLGNELQTRSDWSGYDTNDWGITTYNVMNTFLKRYDRTRPTTVAMFPARAGAQRGTPDFKTYLVPPELACATEISSFNYQWDAYHGYYDCKPDMILFQSEAVTNQMLQPFWGMDRQRGVGLAYWGGIEYWGESNGWPKKGWNYSFFRHTMEPYPQAWLVKSAFMPETPVCHIGIMDGKGESVEWNDIKVGQQKISNNWNKPEGSKQNVFVYTNAQEAELFVNGKSVGINRNDTTEGARRNIIYFAGVEYGKGGTLTAVARNNGKEVARDQIQSTGKAVAVKVVAEERGTELQYLMITAVDAQGRTVPTAQDQITVTVNGAELVATDNGDHYTDEIFRDINTRKLYAGTCQAILRRQGNARVTVTVTSPTLKKATIKL